jgi:site-specific DNA-methyltransferase (adenine-specific)
MSEKLTVPISQVKENPDNPRIIKDAKFKTLVNSIKEFPEMADVRELVVNKDYVILGGNMRFKAMKEAGWKEVPVRVVDWSEEKQREFVIKDNVSGGEWDWDSLANQYEPLELEEWGMDLPKSFFEEEDGTEEDGDIDIDEHEEPKSELGSIYKLGNHRLMCADATDLDQVQLLMNGVQADIVFTDPPYNTGMTGDTQGDGKLWRGDGKKAKGGRLNHMFDDAYTDDEWQQFMMAFCANYNVIMKDDSVAYICLDWRRNHELVPHLKENFKLSNIIVWDKVVHGLGSDYKYTYELLNVCKKGKPVLNTHQGEDAEYSDVWHIQRKMGRDEEHATKKPLELVERALRHASKEGAVVVDLFGGSGSTLIAAEQMNRSAYIMELDPRYVDLIRRRYWKTINDGNEDGWEENTPATEEDN